MRTGLALACALAVVLAGCAAPTSPTRATTDAARDVDIRVEDENGDRVPPGRLPVDANLTFLRVQDLLGTNVSPPEDLQVREPSPVSGGGGGMVRPFWGVMGVEAAPPRKPNGTEPDLGINGFTTALGDVALIYENGTDPARVEYVLAHEYVHFVQVSRNARTTLNRNVSATTDGAYVVRSVMEGGAVYATDRYIDRHVGGNVSNSALYLRIRRLLPAGSVGRYLNSWYVFGGRYVASRVDDPARLDAVYRRPPTTSEQVIHRLPPGAEPPRSLSVNVSPGDWRSMGSDRVGEAFLRVALQNGLAEARADRAAAGWGNDRLRVFRPRGGGGDASYAWVLRWDDAANASEFRSAFADWLDARGDATAEAWTVDGTAFDLRTAGQTTSVVLAGDRRFVANATVEGADGQVRIGLPGSATASTPRRGNSTRIARGGR